MKDMKMKHAKYVTSEGVTAEFAKGDDGWYCKYHAPIPDPDPIGPYDTFDEAVTDGLPQMGIARRLLEVPSLTCDTSDRSCIIGMDHRKKGKSRCGTSSCVPFLPRGSYMTLATGRTVARVGRCPLLCSDR